MKKILASLKKNVLEGGGVSSHSLQKKPLNHPTPLGGRVGQVLKRGMVSARAEGRLEDWKQANANTNAQQLLHCIYLHHWGQWAKQSQGPGT